MSLHNRWSVEEALAGTSAALQPEQYIYLKSVHYKL